MSKHNNMSPTQVIRIDGRSQFLEVMASALPIDKVLINFVQYNKAAEQGKRATGSIQIYISIFEAARFASDILTGRIPKEGERRKKEEQEKGNKYFSSIFSSMGGISARNRPDHIAVSRQFKVAPGSSQPWVLSAEIGPGKENETGLIVPNYQQPDLVIRVPLTDEKLKELALAINLLVQIWGIEKFGSLISKPMEEKRNLLLENIRKAKEGKGNGNGM